MRTVLSAISFLTIFRRPRETDAPGRAAIVFPIFGAILGAAGAALYLAAGAALPSTVAALMVVALWTAIARVPREDGHMGTAGMAALAFSVIARWLAIEHLATERLLAVMIASQAVPRAALVGLAWISRPAGTGRGFRLSSTLTTIAAAPAMALGIAAALACGLRPGVIIALGAYLTVRGVQMYFYRTRGGVDADGLGVVEQMLEIFILVLFTCQACSW